MGSEQFNAEDFRKQGGGHIQNMPLTALQQMKRDFEAMGFKFPLPEPLQTTMMMAMMTLVTETTQTFATMMVASLKGYCKTIDQATEPVEAMSVSLGNHPETAEDKQKRFDSVREHFEQCPMCGDSDGFEDEDEDEDEGECCTLCGLPVHDQCTCPRPGSNRCGVCSLLEANCQCAIFDNATRDVCPTCHKNTLHCTCGECPNCHELTAACICHRRK